MAQDFEIKTVNGVDFYAVPFLERTGLVKAAFTTRRGGVSGGETATMNFSSRRADTWHNIRENYRRICAAAGFPPESLAISRQVHGVYVHEPLPNEVGRGIFDDYVSIEADGLMTDQPGVTLVKHSADCVSIYLLDTTKPAIALLHGGWRGTMERIAQEGLKRMAQAYGTKPQDCVAAIGPSIGPCCFEVGEDVALAFENQFPGWGLVKDGHVDLWRCNKLQLLEAGIPQENIAVSQLCTACDTQTFYSHRAEKGRTGAMAALLMLN